MDQIPRRPIKMGNIYQLIPLILNVIYKKPLKNGAQNSLLGPVFSSFFTSKPLYLVVKPSYLPFKPLFVIRIILSTCLEDTKKMSHPSGIPLAGAYFYPQRIFLIASVAH